MSQTIKNNMKIMDGNEAAAYVAYRVTELSAIYPITPSTTMGELADEWSAAGKKNIWGNVPQVVELQSEGGASGTLHGALQTGALATTYTASQGLLLMIPNMYKIAGELTPTVIHVASRALAAQGLSIFGDHNDVMSIRSTGFAMLASGSVQEAHDLALIAHAATLESRIPFLHFFEGFRVSHELNKIDVLTDEQLHAMIDDNLILAHRDRALNPEHPCLRGTAQNPDIYFQGRETVNAYYEKVPAIVEKYMQKFRELTGREYKLMQYSGDANAERVIIIIGSAAKTVLETVNYLNKNGEKIGVLQIHLYRPFCAEHFLAALPASVKSIAVLDRTKEPGSLGEPLYQDVITAIALAFTNGELHFTNGMPQIVGGRYGLSSKEFTPAMAKAVFDELKNTKPKNHFTIGINDDVTHSSIDYDKNLIIGSGNIISALFFGLGADGTVSANKNTIKIIGAEPDYYAQGYFVYDSKKAGSKTVSHLRFGKEPIQAPYLIQKANFVGCHQFNFVENINVLEKIAEGATFLLNSPYAANEVWQHLPCSMQQQIIAKKIKFFVIDAYKVAAANDMGNRINTVMQTCFFAISGVLPKDIAIEKIKQSIEKTYKRKGQDIVAKNFAAVDSTLENLHEVIVPNTVTTNYCQPHHTVSLKAPEFVRTVLAKMMEDRGDELPVSAIPVDGTYPTATTQWEKRNISQIVAQWNPDLCIQCGQCSMICPHSVIRVKHHSAAAFANAPKNFTTAKMLDKKYPEDLFKLQVYVEDCTGCTLCNVVCPAISKVDGVTKAITMQPKEPILEQERKNIDFFETLPYVDRKIVEANNIRGAQYLRPLFEFSSACSGCGETPYLRLVSQLFGDRMLVANATGCSSIYGGNLPTTPWCKDVNGRGPAWANSLFEDNAEFGYGFRLTEDQSRQQAFDLATQFSAILGDNLLIPLKDGIDDNTEAGIFAQRERVVELKQKIQQELSKTTEVIQSQKMHALLSLADHLVRKSVWIIGGDGWAYDIGFGGLDHVLASGRNVNVLVLDTGVYSNTGGQSSKATPRGAVAKFAASGKSTGRKDLGLMMMSYGNIYVAQTSIGAKPAHALQVMREAESFNGPSLIIAYSSCIAHGINMRTGVAQQRLAVDSGFWPLYRYNPDLVKQNLNPFQLDSRPPSIAVQEFAYNEPRFKVLCATDPARAQLLLQELQDDVYKRWQLYTEIAKK